MTAVLLALLYVAAWYSLPHAADLVWSDSLDQCGLCHRQPCTCAITKDPQWLVRLEQEAEAL